MSKKKKEKLTHVVAVLDRMGRLIGLKEVDEVAEIEIEVGRECDLPLDGSYKYDDNAKAFFPIGSGFPRADRQPISEQRVLYQLCKVIDDHPDLELPEEASQWLAWYKSQMQARDEERITSHKRRQQRGK